MKYGELFETESVPEWSLHNIDYNSLKHFVKARTTKGQATAIAIPGHQDAALRKFEDEFYTELCHQHARVGLFVTSKADELSRRLQHLSDCIHDTLLRCAQRQISPRRQRRLARYAQQASQCGEEIHDLERFVNAQVVAFRKILKKYKKWTGSQTLGPRFRDSILSDPKSFTNRDFHQLQVQYDDLSSELLAVTPQTPLRPDSPPSVDEAPTPARPSSVQFQEESLDHHRKPREEPVVSYWNEYDNGSEAGEDEGYTIYVDPDEETYLHIPGLSSILHVLSMPVEKAKSMLSLKVVNGERQPLLPNHMGNVAALQPDPCHAGQTSYGTHGRPDTANGRDVSPMNTHAMSDGYSAEDEQNLDQISDDEFPRGYDARFAALPSINEQRIARYRDRVLFWGSVAANVAAVVLLGVASLLIMTGKHRLRVEVDAGVIVGVMASLAAACAALGMTLARNQDTISWINCLVVYLTFTVICILNGMLLVLVMGNTVMV
ncbi:hypothetical protein MCOR02_003262 [Pyricularia oryzae]|nr:hypothetical protein MCOR02_003262 [Pyricularia oryzae]KAI6325869.1 hypothetical protein MCOR34_001079 [Pyricularia oryzae]KAI6476476.1 hypothetical protein MCOR17_001046 [Pyricularia oryzae]KAI6511547.1 hypothetical protein MCOR13_000515 [Pyricularia oryzae]KAI6642754.1 hypothetical protein MCOR14_002394 [Pyricularia oryzae]